MSTLCFSSMLMAYTSWLMVREGGMAVLFLVTRMPRKNDQSIFPLFDGFLNGEQMRLTRNLRESELFHNRSEFGVPHSSGLLETVECLFKVKDLAFWNIHSLGSFHVDLLIEIPVKVGVLNVDLTYFPVLLNGKHKH